GCCPSPYCSVKSKPCSINLDCQCLWMTMTGEGMCADIVVSCEDLVPCENDNKTCSVLNTVCVNNTRCSTPVCFPITRASSQRCPPLTSTVIVIHKHWQSKFIEHGFDFTEQYGDGQHP
ncbi:unnamed protein product, partial [Rotaria sp. Silwood1]